MTRMTDAELADALDEFSFDEFETIDDTGNDDNYEDDLRYEADF